jgi:hypothetical protein
MPINPLKMLLQVNGVAAGGTVLPILIFLFTAEFAENAEGKIGFKKKVKGFKSNGQKALRCYPL